MMLYQVSRGIYRALSEDILPDPCDTEVGSHARVLRACEATLDRLVRDRETFPRPARALFNDIRGHFPVSAQGRVWAVVEGHIALALEYLDRLPQTGVDIDGNPIQCRATTRRGTSCQRVPLPHNGYCPSHQHLAQTEHVSAALVA